MANNNSSLSQLSLGDLFEDVSADNIDIACNKLPEDIPELDRGLKKVEDNNLSKIKFSKDKVTFPKEIEDLIEQFFAGKI